MALFSKTEVPDTSIKYGDYKIGDIDPTTGKKIKYLAYQTSQFYVSIDSAYNLNWSASENMAYPEEFGEVASHVSLTEALVDRIFEGPKNRMAYKKILAEVLSRLLEGNSKSAMLILEEAKLRVVGHSEQRVRMAYINYAFSSVIAVGLLVLLLVLNKQRVLVLVGDKEIFRIMVCTLLGGIGAFITTFSRFNNYQGKIISGLSIHRLDGFLRVFYGLIAGIIISLAIKGRVLAGFADSGSPWLLYFFAMIAGASEALIPNLIRQAERQTNLIRPEPAIADPIIPPPVQGVPVVPPVVDPAKPETVGDKDKPDTEGDTQKSDQTEDPSRQETASASQLPENGKASGVATKQDVDKDKEVKDTKEDGK